MSGLGDLFGTDDSEAQSYLQQALQQYQNVNVPTVASETVSNLPQETVQGTVNPESITAAQQAPSAFNDISLDPATRAAQIQALSGYTDIANAGGLDANAKLGIQQAINAANTQSQGAQGAIMNAAQAEGQGGGDFALTQRALAAQNASNNVASEGQQEAAEAEVNRENALSQMGTLGGSINASDYNQAATKAAAQNAINATNQSATNAASTNNAVNNLTGQQFNVSNAQGVNAANTTASQNNAYYNAGLPQQQFNNELQKASGAAGVNQNQAGVAQQSQQNAANATGQLLKGGLTLGASALGGPVAGAIVNSATAPSSTNSTIAGSDAYQKNANANNPNFSDGGMCGYSQGGAPHNHYMCMLMGGPVPGKAPVDGDSPQNDIVDAKLSPGEIVIKRTKAADPDEAAKEAKKISMENFTKGYKKGRK